MSEGIGIDSFYNKGKRKACPLCGEQNWTSITSSNAVVNGVQTWHAYCNKCPKENRKPETANMPGRKTKVREISCGE